MVKDGAGEPITNAVDRWMCCWLCGLLADQRVFVRTLRRVTLTREEVEEACVGVAEGVQGACREALRAAGLAAGDVQDVELLGGGSYIPLLRRSVESTFG